MAEIFIRLTRRTNSKPTILLNVAHIIEVQITGTGSEERVRIFTAATPEGVVVAESGKAVHDRLAAAGMILYGDPVT